MFDYSKVRGRIREMGYTLRSLAPEVGISYQVLSTKLSKGAPIQSDLILSLSSALKIGDTEIKDYFFTRAVQQR